MRLPDEVCPRPSVKGQVEIIQAKMKKEYFSGIQLQKIPTVLMKSPVVG